MPQALRSWRGSTSLLAMMLLAGCAGSNLAAENDSLRRQVLELKAERDELTQRNAELLAELEQGEVAPDAVPEEIRANTPHVTAVSIGRLSHARDEDDDGAAELLLVYVKPEDGLGRFVQLVGRLSVTAVLMPTDADAITVGRVSLAPSAVRAAYRSGLMGTHYTVEVPIELPAEHDQTRCVVKVTYEDGRTGTRREAEATIKLLD